MHLVPRLLRNRRSRRNRHNFLVLIVQAQCVESLLVLTTQSFSETMKYRTAFKKSKVFLSRGTESSERRIFCPYICKVLIWAIFRWKTSKMNEFEIKKKPPPKILKVRFWHYARSINSPSYTTQVVFANIQPENEWCKFWSLTNF